MATKTEVEQFLRQFKVKLNVFGILFLDNRSKNAQSLLDLGITQLERLEIVKSIEVSDYKEGPVMDTLNHFGEMWVFGKDVKGQEVYIKISMGQPNSNTICISFHIAESPIHYPFKDQTQS